jgi:hypothetical protein
MEPAKPPRNSKSVIHLGHAVFAHFHSLRGVVYH